MKAAILILMCTAATAAGARVVVPLPLTEAPMTLQTLAVCLTALCLPFGHALLAMLLYVGLGVAGLPIFAGGASGVEVLQGPSGGYLVGFVAAVPAVALGKLVFSGDRLITQMIFAGLFAHVAILGLGAAWLHYGPLARTWYLALDRGVWPYLLGAVLKSAVAGVVAAWISSTKSG